MYLKIHSSYRNVVAVCDEDLIGKYFEEGKRQLHVKENFYKGDVVEYAELVSIMKKQQREDATFNIVGEQAIKAAFEAGIIKEGNVAYVQNIPFALVLL